MQAPLRLCRLRLRLGLYRRPQTWVVLSWRMERFALKFSEHLLLRREWDQNSCRNGSNILHRPTTSYRKLQSLCKGCQGPKEGVGTAMAYELRFHFHRMGLREELERGLLGKD